MGIGNFKYPLHPRRIPALCAGIQMVIFGWGLSAADSCCQHQLCGNPSSPVLPLSPVFNAGLGSTAWASAVNYRMCLLLKVWPTWFAQPLCIHRVWGHLCSVHILQSLCRADAGHALLILIAVRGGNQENWKWACRYVRCLYYNLKQLLAILMYYKM